MSGSDIDKSMHISHLFDYYGKLLSERQRDIINLYYNDDLSLSEISELIGISRQGVRDAIKKSEVLLAAFEVKCEFASKMDSVIEAADNLLERLDLFNSDPEIRVLSEKLKTALKSAYI